jgi:hypothetical protein
LYFSADQIIARIFRTLKVQIAELIVKIRREISNIATENRDVLALSPLGKRRFPQFSLNKIFLGLEINLIPLEEQDQMESKQMITPVSQKAKEEENE